MTSANSVDDMVDFEKRALAIAGSTVAAPITSMIYAAARDDHLDAELAERGWRIEHIPVSSFYSDGSTKNYTETHMWRTSSLPEDSPLATSEFETNLIHNYGGTPGILAGLLVGAAAYKGLKKKLLGN